MNDFTTSICQRDKHLPCWKGLRWTCFCSPEDSKTINPSLGHTNCLFPSYVGLHPNVLHCLPRPGLHKTALLNRWHWNIPHKFKLSKILMVVCHHHVYRYSHQHTGDPSNEFYSFILLDIERLRARWLSATRDISDDVPASLCRGKRSFNIQFLLMVFSGSYVVEFSFVSEELDSPCRASVHEQG